MKQVRDLRLMAEAHEEWDTNMIKMVLWIMFCVGNFDLVLIPDNMYEQAVGLMSHKRKEQE